MLINPKIYEYEENGIDESSYHSLHKMLSTGTKKVESINAITGKVTSHDVPSKVVSSSNAESPVGIPIILSEMGCSKELFNRDNNAEPKGVRTWNQISVVSENGEMIDVVSGYVVYGYDGGGRNAFRMMGGNDLWDGENVLPPSDDYNNFRHELSKVVNNGNASGTTDQRMRRDDSSTQNCGAVQRD